MREKVSMRLKSNLRGQVRQTPLPKWKAILPLIEAAMNAFQAIQEAPQSREHRIIISCERDSGGLALGDEPSPITSFSVSDTGIGFNDANFNSFNTAFSDHKDREEERASGALCGLLPSIERAFQAFSSNLTAPAIYPARRIASTNVGAFIKNARECFEDDPLVPIEAWGTLASSDRAAHR